MNPELLEGLFEGFRGHSQLTLELRPRDRLRMQGALHLEQQALVRVVSVEEPLVGSAVRIAVVKNRPRWKSVASGAPDLLVVALDACG